MGNPQTPSLSIIIATKEGRHLGRCLQALQGLPDVQSYEVLVIVDEALESSKITELKQEFSDFQFYLSHLGGVSNARNLGLRISKGRYFIFLDDDCLIENPEIIARIFEISAEENRVHGGSYILKGKSNYWNRVYQAVNQLWLRSGQTDRGQVHLLGGFIFGSAVIKAAIVFPAELRWGGEEKEMLLNLERQTSFSGRWHSDFSITHIDESNFDVFAKRAYRQGVAAGKRNLSGALKFDLSGLAVSLIPGLILFLILSRVGILRGKIEQVWSKASVLGSRLPLQNSKREK